MDSAPAPGTVTEAIEILRSRGYTADFELIDGVLSAGDACPSCDIGRAVVEHLYRFEGPSDPGDEMIVFAVRDPDTDVRGTLATAFGPSADPELREHLTGLRTRFA